MICTALLIGTISTIAIVMIAMVAGTPNVLANHDQASSPIVSTHESSGIQMPTSQTHREMLAAPNYTLDGPGAVSPDPYHPMPTSDCVVPYQTTAGGKTVLKYGTIEGCSSTDAPQQPTESGTHA